jgi:hypothetical protein
LFSSRLPPLTPNALAVALERVRASGVPYIDLTVSNPTSAEIPYPPDALAALSDPRALRYEPDARGLKSAREAIARSIGAAVDPDALVLTASTSEAYALLFKLLCNPGEAVLVPQPSYPLFDLLTQLEGVTPRPYRLEYHGVWSIDRESVMKALSPDVRAVLVVSPNNPTGAFVRAADRDWLAGLAADRNLAIISDEVFAGYPLRRRPDAASFINEGRALTFVLGGLSKSAGLPQVKLGWIGASGPDTEVRAALERLDVIADTYLSVSTPVQVAAPALLAAGASVRAAIQARLTGNLAVLQSRCERWPGIEVLEPEGGWTAVIRVPATMSEEALVIRLLEEARVLVHPGYFFDFPREAFLAVSLLTPPAAFAGGIDRALPLAAGGAA